MRIEIYSTSQTRTFYICELWSNRNIIFIFASGKSIKQNQTRTLTYCLHLNSIFNNKTPTKYASN